MSQIPTLTIARLVLRPFTLDDVDPLYEILQQENIMAYFPGTKTPPRDAVERLVQAQLREWAERGYGWWAVAEKDQPAHPIVGWCGLGYLPDTDETEVAYLLSKDVWGQGYATEGARASVEWGFSTLDLDEIVGIVHPENIASQRVLEKLGMDRTARTEYFGMDCYRYALQDPRTTLHRSR